MASISLRRHGRYCPAYPPKISSQYQITPRHSILLWSPAEMRLPPSSPSAIYSIDMSAWSTCPNAFEQVGVLQRISPHLRECDRAECNSKTQSICGNELSRRRHSSTHSILPAGQPLDDVVEQELYVVDCLC